MHSRNELQLKIRSMVPSLVGAVRKTGEALSEMDPRDVKDMSARELAKMCGVSEGTVTRFAKMFGFSGYTAFKEALAQPPIALEGVGVGVYGEWHENETHDEMCDRVANDNTLAIRRTREILDPAELDRAVTALTRARRIVILGLGRSGLAAEALGARLASLGYATTVSVDSSQQYIALSTLDERDVVIIFSMSGLVRSSVICAQLAKRNGATLIDVTSSRHAPVAELSDIVLMVAGETPRINDHSFSTILFLTVADCIFMGLYSRIAPEERARLLAYRAVYRRIQE